MSSQVVEENNGEIANPSAPRRGMENGGEPAGAGAADTQTQGGRKRSSLIIAGLAVLIIGIVGGAFYFRNFAPYESTNDAYIDGHVISISPQVSAVVAATHIDDNRFVHKGDLLVELDPTDYRIALNQARGAQTSAKGRLDKALASVDAAQSAVAQAQAGIYSAQATLENADRDVKRYRGLSPQARSQQAVDSATAHWKLASAGIAQAKARLNAAQTQVISARASVVEAEGDYRKAQADSRRAEVNLEYCRIVAPADGRITNKAVEPGAYVTPADPLFQIVAPRVWVVANFKETQLTYMKAGQPVKLTVDAYPGMVLRGRVDSIQAGTGSRFSIIPVQNATGNFVKVVQRVPVKIALDTRANTVPAHLLSPGMSVEPRVRVHCTGCWDRFYALIAECALFRKAS
jgi:membrane fusion protein (multidrug efflux system)